MIKIGIFGHGETGTSLERIYSEFERSRIFIKDLVRDDDLQDLDVLDICISYDKHSFVDVVSKQILESNPTLTIIHSTVFPGTTQEIIKRTNASVVHSPIRGVHPNLAAGIKTFVKYVGTDNDKDREDAVKHFEDFGIVSVGCSSSKVTELGKILSTTYYGTVIAWHGEMKRFCDEVGVDFEETVTNFNETYNDGYTELGKTNVVRPILIPPNGKIGGHCIIQNAEILSEICDSTALQLILQYGGDLNDQGK